MSEYDLNNPQSDVESYLANMDGILAPLPLPPESNVEKYLAHIVGVQGVELPNKPDSRVEAYLEKLALDPPQPVTPVLIEKSVTNNGVYSASDDNADGYSKVTVEVPDPVLDDITITENGVYTSEHDGFDEVTVEVEPPANSYQLKSITTPTSLATFNASAMPMPKLKASIVAKQDLHGYDHPWVGGSGKNKLEVTATSQTINGVTFTVNNDGTIIINGTASANASLPLITSFISTASFTSHKLVDDGNGTFSNNFYLNIRYYDNGGSAISNQALNSGKSIDMVIPSTAETFAPSIFVRSGQTISNVTIKPMICLQSETNSFEPYSNICPISGWDAVVVSDRGKNLVEETISTASVDASGKIIALNDYDIQIAKVKANETYTITSNELLVCGFYTTKPSIGSVSYDGSRLANKPKTFVAPIDGYIAFRTASGYATPQCEVGTSATEYVPYVEPNLYTISLGQTVYGGEVDVVNGSSGNKITYGYVELPKTGWGQETGVPNVFSNYAIKADSAYPQLICSHAIRAGNYNSVYNNVGRIGLSASRVLWHTTFATVEELEQYLANNTVQIAYELATPTTFTTQPSLIKSLNGQNNLSVDSGEVIEGEYFKAL